MTYTRTQLNELKKVYEQSGLDGVKRHLMTAIIEDSINNTAWRKLLTIAELWDLQKGTTQ